MKNILWFFHKPVDERERSIYGIAYQRSLSVILVSFVIFIIAFSLFQFHTIPHIGSIMLYVLWIVLVIADIAGWTALRQEELEVTDVLSTSVRIKPILFSVGAIILSQIIFTFTFPQLYLLIGVVTFFGLQGVLMLFAWFATPKVFLPFRILLSAFCPLFVIIFLKLKRKNLVIRFFESVIVSFCLVTICVGGLFIINLFLLRGYIVTPVYVSTDYFESELPKESMQYADLRDRNFELHDFVTFIGDDGKLRIGKITIINGDTFSIDSSDRSYSLKTEEIHGRILDKDQGVAKLNSSFERFLIKSFAQ